MNGVIIIGSDTIYRRFLINRIYDSGAPLIGCIFERNSILAPFPIKSSFDKSEKDFMQSQFNKICRTDLDRIKVWEVSDINSIEAFSLIKNLKPSLGLASGSRKIKQPVISLLPKLINIHLGITQEYRGLDSNFWAIYHKDWKNIGVTIHHIDNNLDTGPILSQEKILLEGRIAIDELRYYEFLLATRMALEKIMQLQYEDISGTMQEKLGRYYSFMPSVIKDLLPKKI